jgi:adenosylhomocysteine nucleosidase
VRIVAVTGLNREAKIVAGPGVTTVAGGGDNVRLRRELGTLASGAGGIISIGIAGALHPSLNVGDAVVASAVAGEGGPWQADPQWASRLAQALPQARLGLISGRDQIAADARAKGAIQRGDGSFAVDMESHVVAAVAAELGLPFAAVRFISDSAARGLPKAALLGMKPDGGMDLVAVLGSIAADPRQIPALIRTGMEAEAAFRALLRSRDRLGPTLGFADI